MAQTAPLPGEGIPRPLPRGGRPPRSRDTRPRFQPLDVLWMVLLAAVFIVVELTQQVAAINLIAATGVIFLTYLIGWRSSGRSAGIIAGLLLAAGAPFTQSVSQSLQTDLFALLSLGALFAFVAGSSLTALILAALAVWLRADGIMLGLILMTFTLIQHRRRALLGTLIFVGLTLTALFAPHTYRGQPLASVTFGFHSTLLVCLAAPAMLFAAWFLLPFFGEMVDPIRRARWLPIVIWTAVSAVLSSGLMFGHTDTRSAALVPFLPFWFLLIGAGLARLLPVMTGDLPIPWLRYTVATLAVLSLVAIRVRSGWVSVQRPVAISMHTSLPPSPPTIHTAPVTSGTLPASKLLNPALVRPEVAKNPPKPKAHLTATLQTAVPKAVKPAVRQYVIKNGRLVRRSKWAIQWDLTHPHP